MMHRTTAALVQWIPRVVTRPSTLASSVPRDVTEVRRSRWLMW